MKSLRDLSKKEIILIETLLGPAFTGRDALRSQLDGLRAEDPGDDDNYGSILLHPLSGPRAELDERIPVEAVAYDKDGVEIAILLHVVEGLLNELEIYKVDGAPIQLQIDPKNMEVVSNV